MKTNRPLSQAESARRDQATRALEAIRRQAAIAGTDRLTLREINAEIAAWRAAAKKRGRRSSGS
jgi:hypothetical protein